MLPYSQWDIYDLSAIRAAENIHIRDEIGICIRRHSNLKLTIADIPLWDCQSIQLKRKIPPLKVWEEIKQIKADVIGISIKSPIMGELFDEYSSFFGEKAGYMREISPRILPIDREIEDIWEKSLDKKARNAVRRAKKSVKVEKIDPLDHVEEIYECNRSKKGVPPCYLDKECIKKEIEEYKKDFGDLFCCIGAILESKLVGYAYIIFVNRDLALFSKFFINYKFRSISIGEILLWSGIEVAVERKMRFLQYGSWSRYHSGLDMFLEHFGFNRGFKTLNIYIPLTLKGRSLLLQKRIFNRVINSDALVKLSQSRFLRDRWYLFKALRRKLG